MAELGGLLFEACALLCNEFRLNDEDVANMPYREAVRALEENSTKRTALLRVPNEFPTGLTCWCGAKVKWDGVTENENYLLHFRDHKQNAHLLEEPRYIGFCPAHNPIER